MNKKMKQLLLTKLVGLLRKEHYYNGGDEYYSCVCHPYSPSKLCGYDASEEKQRQYCDCGYFEHNDKVNELISLIEKL